MVRKGKGLTSLRGNIHVGVLISIEVFTRLQLLVALGYKIDGAILAACVLFAMYFGDFIHVIAPVGVM